MKQIDVPNIKMSPRHDAKHTELTTFSCSFKSTIAQRGGWLHHIVCQVLRQSNMAIATVTDETC
jgi:hypothetical protein